MPLSREQMAWYLLITSAVLDANSVWPPALIQHGYLIGVSQKFRKRQRMWSTLQKPVYPVDIALLRNVIFVQTWRVRASYPDCVTACPNGVFYFGDENEDSVSNGAETVRLSTLLKDKAAYRYMEELGTKPRVYYLPPSNRMFPVERGFKNLSDEIKERYKDVTLNIFYHEYREH